jgi:Peptidase family M23/Bacterial SH3 domain/Transglycosylase SLT domain
LSYKSGGREFRASRSDGTRAHAACDLIAAKGTEILAMEDGQIIEGPYYFYEGTYAIEIKHDSGMVVRYGEISQTVPVGITVGARVSQGQVIARVGQLTSGSSMLHLEIYQGTKTGNLTQSGNEFNRRSDLVDPTPFLDAAPIGTTIPPLNPNQGRVNSKVTSTLNARNLASTSSPILFTLSPGATCTVLKAVTGGTYNPGTGNRDDWYEIKVGMQTGFVAAYYLDVGSGSGGGTPNVVNSLGRVNSRVTTSLNVRNAASITAKVVFTVSPGDTFKILEELIGDPYEGGRTDWLKIEKSGKAGFAAGFYIDVNEESRPKTRWDRALPNVPTNGASTVTASQDGLPPGIASSEKMAQTDLDRVKAITNVLCTAANKFGVPTALIAALASRESRCGNVLTPQGWGDNDNAFGILQVDKRFHAPEGTVDSTGKPTPASLEHTEQATGIFVEYLNQIEKDHTGWEDEFLLKGAVVAYNAGVSTVQTKNGMDIGTTGDDFGSDVIARAKFYLNHSDLPMFRT